MVYIRVLDATWSHFTSPGLTSCNSGKIQLGKHKFKLTLARYKHPIYDEQSYPYQIHFGDT